MSFEEQLSEIGRAIDKKETINWWVVDGHIGLLRELHGKLLKMKPEISCQHCQHYNLKICKKAGKEIPDHVRQKGCELFDDNIKDLMI